ncbi:MAG TPA: ACT domain-containing protein [Anaeromyxobacteraceae bacterium]|nr:ACT domain-containing protein [Anaeromyxobacteraceae bacterium]
MPKAKQLSAWVEDRPGMLGQVADALGEAKVGIRAFMAATFDGRGFVRVVVDKPAVARRIFKKHGWETTEDEVVEVRVKDRPGALGGVADRLGERGVNVLYAYVGTARSATQVNLYLAVSDVKAALAALRR